MELHEDLYLYDQVFVHESIKTFFNDSTRVMVNIVQHEDGSHILSLIKRCRNGCDMQQLEKTERQLRKKKRNESVSSRLDRRQSSGSRTGAKRVLWSGLVKRETTLHT